MDLLSNQFGIRKIARSLNKSPSTIYRDIKKLEQYGYITRTVRSSQSFYNINPSGMEYLRRYWNGEQKTLTGVLIDATPHEKLQIRLHRLQIKYDLLNPISDPSVIQFADYPSEFVKMQNWTKNIISFQDLNIFVNFVWRRSGPSFIPEKVENSLSGIKICLFIQESDLSHGFLNS